MRRYPNVLLACALFAFGCTGEQPTSFVDSPTTERPILSKNGEAFPEVIVLPDDFGPEGIAVGEWFAEGHGVEPDIRVPEDPTAQANGVDPQLEAAIEEALRLLEEQPVHHPEPPSSEIRTAPAAGGSE